MDDDGDFLESVRDLFGAWSENSWQIQAAGSAAAALEILQPGEINLVVVDVNLPLLDGVQFLGLLHQRYPGLKKVILTADASAEKRAASLAAGADLFLEKPHSPEGMKAVFTRLGELLGWQPRAGSQGGLPGVGLPDVIQMECLGRNSSILEVCNEHVLGRIYIEEGQLIHAAGGELTGERALQKLLSLPGSSFELVPFEPPPQRTLSSPWEVLLAGAARVKNESGAPPPAAGAELAAATLSAAGETVSLVAETLVCTGTGAPLYEAGCADAHGRMTWLLAVAQQAALLNQILPLGPFDRLEIQFPAGRAVAQAREDRLIYVRVASAPAA